MGLRGLRGVTGNYRRLEGITRGNTRLMRLQGLQGVTTGNKGFWSGYKRLQKVRRGYRK